MPATGAKAQYTQQGVDTVYSYTWGEGQAAGQGPEYFPGNIYGLPYEGAGKDVPANSPEEVLSLGLDGEITVGFKNYHISDGPGPDFTIFENVFYSPITKKNYVEPAVVSVSSNGIDFYEFTFDSTSLAGCAGTEPTLGMNNPFDPDISGGNSFDIADLGLDEIKYIRIRDITRIILENKNHPHHDPTVSGFDLDAVTGIHLEADVTDVDEIQNTEPYIYYQNGKLNILAESCASVVIYDINGRPVKSCNIVAGRTVFPVDLAPGLYFLVLSTNNNMGIKKITVY